VVVEEEAGGVDQVVSELLRAAGLQAGSSRGVVGVVEVEAEDPALQLAAKPRHLPRYQV
jgi:hypothetical protein